MLIRFLDGSFREFAADLSGADLRGADLRGQNLRGANLSGTDLRGADLRGVNLRGANMRAADLSDADLSDADLSGANMYCADLSGADLRGVNLRGTNLSDAQLPHGYRIARIDFGGWSVCVMPTTTTIGCQSHPNEMWLTADPRWISAMDKCATEWWTRYGAVVQAAIRSVMLA